MNKQRKSVLLLIVFVLQLLVPVGMVSYTAYIEWGLENRAAVYKFELRAVEWLNTNYIYLQYDFSTDGIYYGAYCSVKTGADGFADIEVTNRRPSGNYIRSQTERHFNMPTKVRGYVMQTQFSEDDYRWLYFMPDGQKEDWGWRSTQCYFEEAYAELHIFKGHVKLQGIYIDGKTIEECIADCIAKDIQME